MFLRHEGYLGAIGAFLKGAEQDSKYSTALFCICCVLKCQCTVQVSLKRLHVSCCLNKSILALINTDAGLWFYTFWQGHLNFLLDFLLTFEKAAGLGSSLLCTSAKSSHSSKSSWGNVGLENFPLFRRPLLYICLMYRARPASPNCVCLRVKSLTEETLLSRSLGSRVLWWNSAYLVFLFPC